MSHIVLDNPSRYPPGQLRFKRRIGIDFDLTSTNNRLSHDSIAILVFIAITIIKKLVPALDEGGYPFELSSQHFPLSLQTAYLLLHLTTYL